MFDLMFTFFRPRRKPKTLVWRTNDSDFPVTFIKVAGSANGVEYAEVEYQGGSRTYVPRHELVYV